MVDELGPTEFFNAVRDLSDKNWFPFTPPNSSREFVVLPRIWFNEIQKTISKAAAESKGEECACGGSCGCNPVSE